jgi:hypothetical protein
MKTRKTILAMAIVAMTTVIGFSFIACEKDCDCTEKTHLEVGETCGCGADNCSCTTKVSQMSSDGKIKFIKEVGVTEDDFGAIVKLFNDLLTAFSNLSNNITEVRVGLAGTGISHQGKVLFIGCDEGPSTLMPYLTNKSLLTQLQQQKGIYLVHAECQSHIHVWHSKKI